MKKQKGFTLVEILIVVIILGILAAIVIPQFTEASTEARQSTLVSNLQTLRSQIGLYKIQHKDVLPDTTSSATFVADLTSATDVNGDAWVEGTSVGTKCGPYMQKVPDNPFITTANTALFSLASGAPAGDDSSHWHVDTDTGAIYCNDSETTSDDIDHVDL